MARYQAILAYDGTDFQGMQRQVDARTVQNVVEEALKNIGWQAESILVAGRTDAGVHASGQVIAFDLEWGHSQLDLTNALNSNLPADVAVKAIKFASERFHPRYDASSRRYRYSVFCHAQRDPMRERYAWRVWPLLDLKQMQLAAEFFIGPYDFAAFGSSPEEGGPTQRHVTRASWRQEGDKFSFVIEANAFLYHMVRRIVNLLVEIGRGKQRAEIVTDYLERRISAPLQGLAPPNGLSLEQVRYSPEGE